MPRMPGVLVVDDDEAIRFTLRSLFEEEGYSAEETSSAPSAIILLRAAAMPFVVLLDYHLSRFDETNVLAEATRDDLLARHAYILVTAAAPTDLSPLTLRHMEQLGATLVLKPFDLNEMIDTVAVAAARLQTARDAGLPA